MMVDKKKYNVDITVETAYIDTQSSPILHQYVFSYTISITNTGTIPTKLLRRHWLVTNSEGKIFEVEGEGVVGEQPKIKPGETYQYTSGTVLDTPVGTMEGAYQMIAEDGSQLEVTIPPFMLAMPKQLH